MDEAELGPGELLRLLSARAEAADARQRAIACYLAGGEGWRNAGGSLDGAFSDAAAAVRSSGGTAK